MGIRSILARIFGSSDEGETDMSPGETAVERLTAILAIESERIRIAPEKMDKMRHEIIEVIKRYVDIDETKINLALEKEDNSMALVANIPIKKVSQVPIRNMPRERRRK